MKWTMLYLENLLLLTEHLSPEQQKILKIQHGPLHIVLQETTDYRHTDPQTLQEIERAIERSQQLEFLYDAPYTGKERRHRIEPQSLQLKDGHVYLHGWHLDYQNEAIFRLDHIVPG